MPPTIPLVGWPGLESSETPVRGIPVVVGSPGFPKDEWSQNHGQLHEFLTGKPEFDLTGICQLAATLSAYNREDGRSVKPQIGVFCQLQSPELSLPMASTVILRG